jgi:hypothetical protein
LNEVSANKSFFNNPQNIVQFHDPRILIMLKSHELATMEVELRPFSAPNPCHNKFDIFGYCQFHNSANWSNENTNSVLQFHGFFGETLSTFAS